jgi:hypothetical protein
MLFRTRKSKNRQKKKDKQRSTKAQNTTQKTKDRTIRTALKFWELLFRVIKGKNKKYHTVGTIPKSNRKIPHCGNNSKIQ